MSVVSAELLKLRRSVSTWVLVGLLALVQLLLGYLLLYLVLQIPPPEGEADFGREALRLTLLPENLVVNVLNMLASLGGALALVLGAMHSAREYGWRTMTTTLTLGPTRLGVFTGKAVALALIVVVMVIVTFIAGAVGSVLVASFLGETIRFPPLAELAAGLAVGCLILGAWAALGYALGFLLRSTGLAIGLGLVYALVIESIVQGFATINDVAESISRALLGANGTALASSFGLPSGGEEFGPIAIDPPIAAAVLVTYLVAALVVGAAVFARRDVT